MKTNCQHCGKEFEAYPSQKRKYCSRACHYNHVSGKNSPQWREQHIRTKVNRICKGCGKEFKQLLSEVNRGGGKFCGRSCMNSFWHGKTNPRYNQVERICRHCGKKFTEVPARIKDNRGIFCSKQCHYTARSTSEEYKGEKNPLYNRVERNCRCCGEIFFIPPNKIKNGRGIFCSKKCNISYNRGKNNPAWDGGFFPYYGENWVFKRKKIMKRAENSSEINGNKNEKLYVHHIIPLKRYINSYLELCIIPYINDIKYSSLSILPFDLVPLMVFEEANSPENLIVLTQKEHSEYEGMPIGFFDDIRKQNKLNVEENFK